MTKTPSYINLRSDYSQESNNASITDHLSNDGESVDDIFKKNFTIYELKKIVNDSSYKSAVAKIDIDNLITTCESRNVFLGKDYLV